ncbi:TPA: hypothetical protein I2T92_03580 [Staphylococcus aureus]|nr:hypothetical protein [Staphylococcus aureus]HAR7221932.1 hypothetical protein [Staphylococcus aureus]HAR7242341.1 hypothetical protein [Staphylococcus aureus]HAR7245100.1 hypothetical protein [Staphylococcus aureus]HAR7253803.1 hypothetical protein [Staphylococcus aureus]
MNGEIIRINHINNYLKVNAIVVYVLNKRGGYCEKKSNVLTIIKIVTDIVATVLIIRALLNSRKDAK